MMETLGTSHPRLWIHEPQHHFPQTHRIVGLETMPSEPGNVDCVAELRNDAAPSTTPECRGRDAGEDHSHLPPARKLQKAGRERLRRDQLNEQFSKLADVLDPIRPRNDKGSILAESILAVNELRAEIAGMKSEHVALSDESRDLSAEKAELQEEKTVLETQTGQLQDQLNQSGENNQSGFHPGLMANPHYPLMMKASLPPKDMISQDSDQQMPVSPFFSVAPFLHPAYQTFGMLSSRQPPYSHFSHPGQHIHVERPAARYPAPIHPTPVYASKILKASDPPTDLQLQTPGLAPSSKTQHSVSDQEQKTSTMGEALEDAESADEQLPSQLSLSSNSTVL